MQLSHTSSLYHGEAALVLMGAAASSCTEQAGNQTQQQHNVLKSTFRVDFPVPCFHFDFALKIWIHIVDQHQSSAKMLNELQGTGSQAVQTGSYQLLDLHHHHPQFESQKDAVRSKVVITFVLFGHLFVFGVTMHPSRGSFFFLPFLFPVTTFPLKGDKREQRDCVDDLRAFIATLEMWLASM